MLGTLMWNLHFYEKNTNSNKKSMEQVDIHVSVRQKKNTESLNISNKYYTSLVDYQSMRWISVFLSDKYRSHLTVTTTKISFDVKR